MVEGCVRGGGTRYDQGEVGEDERGGGDSESEHGELDDRLVGPVPVGVNSFDFEGVRVPPIEDALSSIDAPLGTCRHPHRALPPLVLLDPNEEPKLS